jgi:hypothetical protein
VAVLKPDGAAAASSQPPRPTRRPSLRPPCSPPPPTTPCTPGSTPAGRLRALANPWHAEWEGERAAEMGALLEGGVVPFDREARAGRFGAGHGDRLAIGWWYGGHSPDRWLDRRAPLPVRPLRLGRPRRAGRTWRAWLLCGAHNHARWCRGRGPRWWRGGGRRRERTC